MQPALSNGRKYNSTFFSCAHILTLFKKKKLHISNSEMTWALLTMPFEAFGAKRNASTKITEP